MRQRFRWSDKTKSLLPIDEWLELHQEETNAAPMIMNDIQPYRSMVDGSVINSRSQHRAHLRQHNCVEVGNDSSVKNPVYKPPTPPPGLKEKIIRAVEQHTRKR